MVFDSFGSLIRGGGETVLCCLCFYFNVRLILGLIPMLHAACRYIENKVHTGLLSL